MKLPRVPIHTSPVVSDRYAFWVVAGSILGFMVAVVGIASWIK